MPTLATIAAFMEPEEFNSRDLAPGTLLWHYTDFTGLQGILAGKLWASSLPYLNDTAEFNHGLDIALDVLQHELTKALHHPSNAAIAGVIYRQVVSFFKVSYKPRDVFVAAFSTKRDDLSQWRAYGTAGGPQFSIGFNPGALEKKANEHLFMLEEVKYERRHIVPDLTLALRAPIDGILEELSGQSDLTVGRCQYWAEEIAGNLIVMAPLYKHPKFEDEQEWRLIRRQQVVAGQPSLPLQFRRSGSLVVPYLELPLHAPVSETEALFTLAQVVSPIVAVTVGPSPHPEHLQYAVGEMAYRMGISVRVDTSTVPFRNW